MEQFVEVAFASILKTSTLLPDDSDGGPARLDLEVAALLAPRDGDRVVPVGPAQQLHLLALHKTSEMKRNHY